MKTALPIFKISKTVFSDTCRLLACLRLSIVRDFQDMQQI